MGVEEPLSLCPRGPGGVSVSLPTCPALHPCDVWYDYRILVPVLLLGTVSHTAPVYIRESVLMMIT